MLSAVKGHLPQLERFDVDILADASDDLIMPLDIFAVAPELHTITMQYNIDSSDWDIPWGQLRCLHFNLYFFMSLSWILQECSNLVRCTVEIYRMDNNLDQLDHSSIVSLHLLLHIEEHALQDLDITQPLGAGFVLTLPQNAVASMLDRSSCNLQHLHLFWVGCSPFHMLHGVHPVLSFDLTEATFMIQE